MKLRVGPYIYSVTHDLPEEAGDDGQCSAKALTIRILPGLPPDRRGEVLWHEVLHAVIDLVHLEDILGSCTSEKHEQVVRRLATASLQVLKQNKELRNALGL